MRFRVQNNLRIIVRDALTALRVPPHARDVLDSLRRYREKE